MSQQFSAAIKLGDLDDYLSPANECIVVTAPSSKSAAKSSVIKPVASKQEKSQSSSSVAGIALSDCLACSGCVTSAETVLLESQSTTELLKTITDSSIHTQFFISISSASRRALSQTLQIPPSQICAHVQTLLSTTIPNLTVIDTSLAEAIAVLETVDSSSGLTLTSHCPGWTCYATKVLGDSILPHLSRVKSPEQIQGLILQYILPRITRMLSSSAKASRKVFHILVSPCFDKKLEILRQDYSGVQMVLSTTELIDLMTKQAPVSNPTLSLTTSVCRLLGLVDSWVVSTQEDAVTGGGYARAATLFESPEWLPEMHRKRPNPDLLRFGDNFIRSHGFKNIQNITRRVRENKLQKGFIEIMACPGGCPRGGGQPPEETDQTKTQPLWGRILEFVSPTNRVDHLAVDHVCQPSEFVEAMRIRSWLIRVLGQAQWENLTRTEWKPIESIGSVKW